MCEDRNEQNPSFYYTMPVLHTSEGIYKTTRTCNAMQFIPVRKTQSVKKNDEGVHIIFPFIITGLAVAGTI